MKGGRFWSNFDRTRSRLLRRTDLDRVLGHGGGAGRRHELGRDQIAGKVDDRDWRDSGLRSFDRGQRFRSAARKLVILSSAVSLKKCLRNSVIQ